MQLRYRSLRCARSILFRDSGQRNVTLYKAAEYQLRLSQNKLNPLERLVDNRIMYKCFAYTILIGIIEA